MDRGLVTRMPGLGDREKPNMLLKEERVAQEGPALHPSS